MINWINSWKQGNKKEKYNLEIRLGTFTLLEINVRLRSEKLCGKFRLMLCNFGFEV